VKEVKPRRRIVHARSFVQVRSSGPVPRRNRAGSRVVLVVCGPIAKGDAIKDKVEEEKRCRVEVPVNESVLRLVGLGGNEVLVKVTVIGIGALLDPVCLAELGCCDGGMLGMLANDL
jgi:hypothetical protein